MSEKESNQQSNSNVGGITNYLEEIHQLRARLAQSESYYQHHLRFLETELAERRRVLREVLDSRGWRIWLGVTMPLRLIRHLRPRVREIIRYPSQARTIFTSVLREMREDGVSAADEDFFLSGNGSAKAIDPEYLAWISNYTSMTPQKRTELNQKLVSSGGKPRFALLLVLDDETLGGLKSSIDSLLGQYYDRWELWLIGKPAQEELVDGQLKRDSRIGYMSCSDSDEYAACFNEMLESTKADFLGLIYQGDKLAPEALAYAAVAVNDNPRVNVIYCDEDKLDELGNRYDHYLKPDYNPDLLLSQDYISRPGWVKCATLRNKGGYRESLKAALHYDALIRICADSDADQIRHIDKVVFHAAELSVDTAQKAVSSRVRAVADYLSASGQDAEVVESDLLPGCVRVRYRLPEKRPLVSIIIPTRNGLQILRQCIESILGKTQYSPYEIIVVDNNSDEESTLRYLDEIAKKENISVLKYPDKFNYSAINNYAVKHAKGELLAFLNNDIEVISSDWLGEMASLALRSGTGAVGAMLWYPDDRIQHAGVALGVRGLAGHVMRFLSKGYAGYNGRAVLLQNYSAVTAACLVMRKKIFDEVSGFDQENLAIAFNDVDLCLRLVEAGYRNVWTPYAELYHHESASRGGEDTPEKQQRFLGELDYMRRNWNSYIEHDPAYNENLTRATENFDLSWR